MLLLALDAIVLTLLLKGLSDEEIGFSSAIVTAFLVSVGMAILANILAEILGLAGVVAAVVVAAGLLGTALSSMYGVEIKRSFLISGIFILVHLAISIGLSLMLHA